MASLLGTWGRDSRQMELTYKGKGQQLFLKETGKKITRFPSVFELMKKCIRRTKGEDTVCLAHILNQL